MSWDSCNPSVRDYTESDLHCCDFDHKTLRKVLECTAAASRQGLSGLMSPQII